MVGKKFQVTAFPFVKECVQCGHMALLDADKKCQDSTRVSSRKFLDPILFWVISPLGND